MLKVNISLEEVPLNEVLSKVEAQVYKYAIEHCRYNASKAGRLLGVSRATVKSKLRLHFPNE